MSKNPNHRPLEYTDEIGNTICERIANGESLKKICESEGMPHRATVHRWLLRDDLPMFRNNYEFCVNVRADKMFDELEEIADSVKPEETNKARLRVDVRKWYLSKIMPKKYGEKLDVTSDGKALKTVAGFNFIKNNGKDNTDNQTTTEAGDGVGDTSRQNN